MIPLSKLHRHVSVPIWYLSIFIFFILAVFYVQKILISSGKQKALSKTFYFLAIILTLRFLLSVVQRVQTDCLILFLLALFIFMLFYQKEFLAGLFLAGAALIKLTPLLFLPFLLFRKKIKTALSCAFSFLVFLFLPSIYLGVDKNLAYLKSWLGVHQNNPPDYFLWYKNQSLLSCLLRMLSKNSSVALLNIDQAKVFVIFIILAVILFGLIFIISKKNKSFSPGFSYLVEISLMLILMILFSPLAWKHTFVHLIIAHLVLIYYLLYINPRDKPTVILLTASFFVNTVLNPELTKPFAQLIQEYSNITWGTLLLYVALLRVAIKYADTGHYSHI